MADMVEVLIKYCSSLSDKDKEAEVISFADGIPRHLKGKAQRHRFKMSLKAKWSHAVDRVFDCFNFRRAAQRSLLSQRAAAETTVHVEQKPSSSPENAENTREDVRNATEAAHSIDISIKSEQAFHDSEVALFRLLSQWPYDLEFSQGGKIQHLKSQDDGPVSQDPEARSQAYVKMAGKLPKALNTWRDDCSIDWCKLKLFYDADVNISVHLREDDRGLLV
jgi:hypothetical protein